MLSRGNLNSGEGENSPLAQILNTRPGSETAFKMPSARTPDETPRFLQQLFAKNVVPHFHEYRAMNPQYAAFEPNVLRMLPTGMNDKVF